MNSMDLSLDQLQKLYIIKSAMLCGGIFLPPSLFPHLTKRDQDQYQGRKGGAGPAGGRYFRLGNRSIVNSPIWLKKKPSTLITVQQIKNGHIFKIQFNDPCTTEKFIKKIHLISIPKFYDRSTENNIPFKKIALMHGDHTLATTIHQQCCYWRSNQQCQFCGIEFSFNNNATILKKSGKQLIQAIRAAREEEPQFATHLTLTIGTQPSPDKGMKNYISVIKSIKQEFPTIPIHIQIEPPKNIKWYKKVKEAGANTIGIHLEILNEEIREKICPGKKNLSKSLYFYHWKTAIEIFGKGQVSSFIITGYDKILQEIKHDIANMIKIGVLPLITPARYIPGGQYPIPKTDFKNYLELNEFAAKKCFKYKINPLLHKAGCIRCGGCSSLLEAYRLEEKRRESK